MKYLIIYITFILGLYSAHAQIFNEQEPALEIDSVNAPIIQIKPDSFDVTIEDTARFVVTEVKILNKGGSPLIIEKVQGSCGCATANINDAVVYPMAIGKMILNINLKGLGPGENIVEYKVYSNAGNNPVTIRINCLKSKPGADTKTPPGKANSCEKKKP